MTSPSPMAHSSNLPCDGNGICMICKKKSAKDLRNSFSSVSNNPPVDSMPFMETKERSFYDTGGDHDQMLTPKGINKGFEEGESTETGYSMDDIWEDIALSESDRMKTVCETIMASPIWNYCSPPPDMLWMMEENEENKLFPAITNPFFACSPNSKNSVTNSLVRRLQGQEENATGEEVAPTPKKIFQLLNQETRT
ncbi:hypothetical protein LOK49_LG13G02329 [Camellia lanceoleosa]|uniref:Uncharacterized protein n=1 Tax=Camellia lanceoleosa TaxID=1840588 RepID=A0ACC0FKB7_9ERIC|nr:hypothetical protein LOK49_LG13G02329 [Camellia lanceoleosa]